TISVDPLLGGTFAPASNVAAPRLTAQQAWARFERDNGDADTGIPSRLQVRLGLLTLMRGSADIPGGSPYAALNELAYGYSAPTSCVLIDRQLPWLPPPHPRCFDWIFLS